LDLFLKIISTRKKFNGGRNDISVKARYMANDESRPTLQIKNSIA
jgi:hypothetical protein